MHGAKKSLDENQEKGADFKTGEELIQEHQPGIRGRRTYYKCKHCGQLFETLPALGLHVRDFHKRTRGESEEIDIDELSDDDLRKLIRRARHEKELAKQLRSLQSKSEGRNLEVFLLEKLLEMNDERVRRLENSLAFKEDDARMKMIEQRFELERMKLNRDSEVFLKCFEKAIEKLDNISSFFDMIKPALARQFMKMLNDEPPRIKPVNDGELESELKRLNERIDEFNRKHSSD
jgi:AraC-like DNA-binding protein